VVVRDLEVSELFYRELLNLRAHLASAQAVLLVAPTGDRLALRELANAPHFAGAVGVRFLVWTVESADDLDRCERVLVAHGALVSRAVEDGWNLLEGRDPDGTRVVLVFPVPGATDRTTLPSRIYQY